MGHCIAHTAGDLFDEDKQAVDTKCVSRYPHVNNLGLTRVSWHLCLWEKRQ